MPRIAPLAEDELSPEARELVAAAERSMGFRPNDGLTMARVPGLLPAVSELVKAIYRPGRVSFELKRLVALVASSAAGCRYCTAHTAHGAHESGVVDPAKLEAVWSFEESPLFSPAERAALRVALGAGAAPSHVSDGDFAELRRHFSEEEVLELVAVLSLFAFLNRWNHTLQTELESSPLAFADRGGANPS